MTTRSERGLQPERVAEIIVGLAGEGKGRRGSGYLVAPGKVLTAAHVVEGALRVQVRFEADRPGERIVEATTAWTDNGIDIAVLTLPDHAGDDVPLVSYGRVGERAEVLTCTAMGFPYSKIRKNAAGRKFRDAECVDARCPVLSNRREGTLDLCLTTPPPAEDPDHKGDVWEGMSGAAVFSDGLLIGVVSRHHRRDGLGRIAAGRVERWAEALDDGRRTSLEALLGRDLRQSALPCAARGDKLERLQRTYRERLFDIAPQRLEDRKEWLADLVSFCAGPERYLWLQGPPWAGKTALAASFALRPPRGVVPVWFFVTGRDAALSDSDAYTAALIEQLAAIVGESEQVVSPSPTRRDAERRSLLRRAAERVAEDGGILLLVVDGLDEDRFLQTGSSGTSIASLLPERPPENVRVLVTSRTSPDLPAQVKGDHPLRSCRVMRLSATAAARHTEHEAKYELERALTGDPLQRDLVGLLAAARGPLTIDDLRGLTGQTGFDLRQRLSGPIGSIVRLRGGSGRGSGPDGYGRSSTDVTLYASTRGYLFAHDTLFTTAQAVLGRDLDAYVERIRDWSESYAVRGWPTDTPPYPLQPYGHLLTQLRDVRRFTVLVVGVRWRDRLRQVTGSDAACLAEIAAARQLALEDAPDDLGSLAALAAAADLVARRNQSLHADIPAAYARLGRVRQAIGLARSVFEPADRVRALGEVARVLAGRGDRRAVGLAEEAVRLSEREPSDFPFPGGSGSAAARGRLATVLAVTGREKEALRCLGQLLELRREVHTRIAAEACLAIASAYRGSARAAGWLRCAEEAVKDVPDWSDAPARIRITASIAEAWAAEGDTRNAERVYDEVIVLAEHGHLWDQCLPVAADVLRGVRPREAEDMARRAALWARWVSHRTIPHDDGSFRLRQMSEAAFALVVADRVDEARETLKDASRDARGPWSAQLWMPWAAIAERSARAGRAADAWNAIRAACEVSPWSADKGHTVAVTVRLLVESGAVDEVESLLLASTDVPGWAVAEGLAALADHFVDGDEDRSLRLLYQAEHGPGSSDRALAPSRSDHLPALAGALAAIGLPDEAERLVQMIDWKMARALGCALVARATGGADRSRTIRLAVQAVDETLGPPPWHWGADTLMTAVQALACVGATEEVLRLFEHDLSSGTNRVFDYDPDRARLVAAAGLWPHDPEAAGRLVDATLTGWRAESVLGLAEILAAVGPHDEERSARMLAKLRAIEAERSVLGFEEEELMSLVTAIEDPSAARERFARATSRWDKSGEPLVHAAFGDHETAGAIARGAETEEERLRGCVEIAAYDAGVLSAVNSKRLLSDRLSDRLAVRCVASLLPPPSGRDIPRARALLREALTPGHWHHALPVLAAVDPDAVFRVTDVVLAHLGLSPGRGKATWFELRQTGLATE